VRHFTLFKLSFRANGTCRATVKSLVTSAIDPVPDVKVAITHMIAENTAIAQIIEGRTWIWILDHELIADSQSVAKRFL
jgi:hypothetical protein